MSKPLYLKLFYKFRNTYQATTDILFQKTTGLLAHIDDARDYLFAGTVGYIPKYTERDNLIFEDRFNQYPHNFCVHAAGTQMASHQNKIKFSERYTAKVARHLGYTTFDGLSYLRAFMEIQRNVGLLPEEYMPGAVNGMGWEEYSKWTKEDEEFLTIANQFRSPRYERVAKMSEVYELFDMGRLLLTGSKWFEGMNRVYGPDYVLKASGDKLGAHCYVLSGYGKLNMINTFGPSWGKNGQALDPGFFENHDYAIYTSENMPIESHWFYISNTLDGTAVKGWNSPEIYYIDKGKKWYIEDWETFTENFNSFTSVSDEALKLLPLGGVYNT